MFEDYFCACCTLAFTNRPSHAVFPSYSFSPFSRKILPTLWFSILCAALAPPQAVWQTVPGAEPKSAPLKQISDFYAKLGKYPGSSSKQHINCTSTTTIHGRDLDNRTDTTLYKARFPKAIPEGVVRFRLLCGDFLLPNQNRTLKNKRPSA